MVLLLGMKIRPSVRMGPERLGDVLVVHPNDILISKGKACEGTLASNNHLENRLRLPLSLALLLEKGITKTCNFVTGLVWAHSTTN